MLNDPHEHKKNRKTLHGPEVVSYLKKGRCNSSLKTNGDEICAEKDKLDIKVNTEPGVCGVVDASLPGRVNWPHRRQRMADLFSVHLQLISEVWSAWVCYKTKCPFIT